MSPLGPLLLLPRSESDAATILAMTESEARRLLFERVGPPPPDQVLVAHEVPGGWSLHVQSREYVETREFGAQLVGQPIFLVRADGSVAEFPSHPHGYAAFKAAAGLTSD